MRKKMSEYMREFKAITGYISLKEEYINAKATRPERCENNTNIDQPEDMDDWLSEEEEVGRKK